MSTILEAVKMAYVPSGYKAGTTYSVIPDDGTGDFTVARADKSMRVNKSGYLEEVQANVPVIGYDTIGGCPQLETHPASENLITYPKSLGNSYWTKSGATIEGDPSSAGSELVINAVDRDMSGANNWAGGGTGSVVVASGVLQVTTPALSDYGWLASAYITSHTIGDLIMLEFDIINATGGTIDIQLDGGRIIHTGLTDGTNQQVFYQALSAAEAGGEIRFRAESGTTYFELDNVSVKEVEGYQAPAIDGSGNILTKAVKLVEDGTTGSHYLYKTDYTITSATNITSAIYAKQDENSILQIVMSGAGMGTNYCNFDLSDGTVGNNSGLVSSNIIALADGWYRCEATALSTGTALNLEILMGESKTDARYPSYTGTAGNGVYLAFPQLEQLDYSSPLMLPVTEGSTTTRVADAITVAGSQALFSSVNSAGCLYAEIAANSDDLSNRYISINGGGSDLVRIQYTTSTNQIQGRVIVGGVTSASMVYTVSDITDFHKVAVKWNENDFALWIDGVEVGTDNSGSIFPASTLNTLELELSGTFPFHGKTKAIYVTEVLTDDELEALTTP